MIAPDHQQVLTGRGIPPRWIIVHPAIAHVHAVDERIPQRSAALNDSAAHRLPSQCREYNFDPLNERGNCGTPSRTAVPLRLRFERRYQVNRSPLGILPDKVAVPARTDRALLRRLRFGLSGDNPKQARQEGEPCRRHRKRYVNDVLAHLLSCFARMPWLLALCVRQRPRLEPGNIHLIGAGGQEPVFPVPASVFLTRGVGVHRDQLTALEFVLRDADIEQQNLVSVSSILPSGCRLIVLARAETNEPGRHIHASIGLARPIDPSLYGLYFGVSRLWKDRTRERRSCGRSYRHHVSIDAGALTSIQTPPGTNGVC